MKKILFILFMVASISSCSTYQANFPAPGERVNPYDQKPVPNDGAASLLRDVINR